MLHSGHASRRAGESALGVHEEVGGTHDRLARLETGVGESRRDVLNALGGLGGNHFGLNGLGDRFGEAVAIVDFDGDGIPEILTEGPGQPLRVWDVDYKAEKRFQ